MMKKNSHFAVTHVTPGRIRLRATQSWSLAHELAASRMRRLVGVRQVAANPLTGSVLVLHGAASSDEMLEVLLAVGVERAEERHEAVAACVGAAPVRAAAAPYASPAKLHRVPNPAPRRRPRRTVPRWMRNHAVELVMLFLGVLGFEMPLLIKLALRAYDVAAAWRIYRRLAAVA